MVTEKDYEVGTTALAAVIATAIKANVPAFLSGEVAEHQALITQIETQGAAAVLDAVDQAHKTASLAGGA